MNIEDFGSNVSKNVGFVRITDSTRLFRSFFGSNSMKIAFNTTENLIIELVVGDLVANSHLKSPIGFLFFYEGLCLRFQKNEF
jgi:hypothetical protein